METLLSVIVPCYNSEKYVEPCLASILPYLAETGELIIINDGSTDNTLDLIYNAIQSYAHKRIVVLSQQNKGLSAARNLGIQVSKGKYITFLDADDYYDATFWTLFPAALQHTDYDIFEFNANRFNVLNATSEVVQVVAFENDIIFKDIMDRLPAFINAQWYAWARIYRAALFKKNRITFPINSYYEDMYTTPQLYLMAKSVAVIRQVLIHYREHKKSISQTFRRQDIYDLISCLEFYQRLVESAASKEDMRKIVYPAAKQVFDLIKKLMIRNRFFTFPLRIIFRLQRALLYFATEFPMTKRVRLYFFPLYFKLFLVHRKK